MTLLALALACSSGSGTTLDTGWATHWASGDTASTTDTEPLETEDTGNPPTLVGTPPSEPLGLPEFTVSNQYGLGRSADYLEGSPVALWFFTTGWTDC